MDSMDSMDTMDTMDTMDAMDTMKTKDFITTVVLLKVHLYGKVIFFQYKKKPKIK
jgi:hypothetical protein